jgi:hypothetical protein
VPCEGDGGGCIAWGILLGSAVGGVSISGSCGGGLDSSSDRDERADSGDGGSSGRNGGSPRAKGIGLTSKGGTGGGCMGLGVTSFSGPSSDPWGAIVANCTNVNVHSARIGEGRTSDD